MTEQLETTQVDTERRTDQINLSAVAAEKVKAFSTRRVATTWRCASPCSPVAAPACATSSSSTSASSTVTSSPTGTA